MNKAVILDRDGTVNQDTMYAHEIEDYTLLPGVVEGLRKLKEKGFIFVVITNQSGIGRGIFNEEQFHKFNNHIVKDLKKQGIEIKKTYYCPHTTQDVCDCRKPSTKYIRQAAKEFDIDLSQSWMLGDHSHDVEMGQNAGTKGIYLLTGHGGKHFADLGKKGIKPDHIAKNFLDAVQFILSH